VTVEGAECGFKGGFKVKLFLGAILKLFSKSKNHRSAQLIDKQADGFTLLTLSLKIRGLRSFMRTFPVT
jgi:hypothetical protein